MNSPINRILYLQQTIGNQAVQRKIKSGAVRAKASRRAQQIFLWMEKSLQLAVKDAKKIDKWNDDAVMGLVILYNKMKNENVWQYVEEIKATSPRISMDFFPKGGHASLPRRLAAHRYVDCLSSWGLNWGVRREKACGPHLHFKHFKAGDRWINVHIDKIDPCCGVVPIIGRVISLLRHYHHDVRGWSKRHPREFIRLLKKQKVPLSAGILKYLKSKGYLMTK